MPISPAARSTISSASRCRRCCGASCPAPARPAACSRWRCRLVCDREAEIERFVREEYWQIAALLKTPRNDGFEARLTVFEGKKLQKLDISNKAQADDIVAMLEGATFRVASVEAKPTKRNPGPPFTTSTLQQAASSNLGFSATRTMQIAQRLYEGVDVGGETGGLITYMRTDGVQMAPEAIDAARARDRAGVRRKISAGKAARLFGQGQERAGSARSDPPDRFRAHAGRGAQVSSIATRRGSTS